jgi:hypothetical protein
LMSAHRTPFGVDDRNMTVSLSWAQVRVFRLYLQAWLVSPGCAGARAVFRSCRRLRLTPACRSASPALAARQMR